MMRAFVTCLVLSASLTPICGATVYYVNTATGDDSWDGLCAVWDGDTCGPKATIQAAIDETNGNDEIVIADGVYTGAGNKDLHVDGKALIVRSANGPDNCIIDCEGTGRGFWFLDNDPAETTVDGLTITGGAEDYGAGIRCYFAHPTIQNCVITGNTAAASGGGIYLLGSHSRIYNCVISGNHTASRGGGIYAETGNIELIGCVISENVAAENGGGIHALSGSSSIIGCQIIANTAGADGGGLYIDFSGTIANCTINGNRADRGGGMHVSQAYVATSNCVFTGNRASSRGGAVMATTFGNSQLANSILWANEAPEGPQGAVGYASTLTIAHDDVEDGQQGFYMAAQATLNWLDGNIDADPLFVDPGHWDDANTPADPNDDVWIDGDYHIPSGSPGVDAGDNDRVPTDRMDLDEDEIVQEPLPFDFDQQPRFIDDLDTADTGSGTAPLVDLGPFEYFADCNGNGIPDVIDIAEGTSQDTDESGVPDECEPKLIPDPTTLETKDQLVVRICMADAQEAIVGGEFFLEYDPNLLDFIDIQPGDVTPDPNNPFVQELDRQIDEVAGHIDYRVGVTGGDPGTDVDMAMAVVTFAALTDDCNAPGLVTFRTHVPTTRLFPYAGGETEPSLLTIPNIAIDVTPPDLTLPPNVEVPCGEPTDPNHTGLATAVDFCDASPSVEYEDDDQGDQILRTWTATDWLDNSDADVQVITRLPCYALGDLNCDGLLNNGDIDPFVLAVTQPATYATVYPDCDIFLADINQDTLVNNGDIDSFVALLGGEG